MLSPEEQYAQLAPTLDADGFSLYAAAEEATGLKVYEEFPYEDNRGMFELADGHTLLRYLEAAYFGTVTWEIVPGTPYRRTDRDTGHSGSGTAAAGAESIHGGTRAQSCPMAGSAKASRIAPPNQDGTSLTFRQGRQRHAGQNAFGADTSHQRTG